MQLIIAPAPPIPRKDDHFLLAHSVNRFQILPLVQIYTLKSRHYVVTSILTLSSFTFVTHLFQAGLAIASQITTRVGIIQNQLLGGSNFFQENDARVFHRQA